MNNFVTRLDRALERELHLLNLSTGSLSRQGEAVGICRKAMHKLKNFTLNHGFQNTCEEIWYFRQAKPLIYGKYIYHVHVYNYLVKRPPGSGEDRSAYIRNYLTDIRHFFEQNAMFYQYIRAGLTHLDEAYFTRLGSAGIAPEIEDFEANEHYATSHDYKLAKIMANEKLQRFLETEQAKLSAATTLSDDLIPFHRPAWTAGKTDAVELIYALKASGAVNNGNIDISELVSMWEYVFQVELKEYYHKYTDITRRKKDTPVFLNKLKDGLLRWINDKFSL